MMLYLIYRTVYFLIPRHISQVSKSIIEGSRKLLYLVPQYDSTRDDDVFPREEESSRWLPRDS